MKSWLEVFNAYAENVKDIGAASQAAAAVYRVALQAHLAGRDPKLHVPAVVSRYKAPVEVNAARWAELDINDVLEA